jgi:hypothetical protein
MKAKENQQLGRPEKEVIPNSDIIKNNIEWLMADAVESIYDLEDE